MIYRVKIYAIDFCGYEDTFEVVADSEMDAEDTAFDRYLQDFADSMGLQLLDDGNWTDSDNINDDGEAIDEDDVTGIMAVCL